MATTEHSAEPAGGPPATSPPSPLSPPPGVERLWLGRVPALAAEALAHRRLLDGAESARLDAFLRPVDRDAYAVAHVALRRLLGERLGLPPEAVALTRKPCTQCGGPHGRPAISGDPVHFSLSHTQGLVLIALAPVPVGADVENLPSATTVDEIAGELHPGERAELAELPAGERPLAFARCWTRKEAVLKASGVGLNEDLARTHVGAGPRPVQVAGWRLSDVPVDPGYAAAVAVAAP
ncbi:4'-phosphopantetheinyl transferase superfamily protein [Streptomyces amakusaensis]|uniref:4'-phosphopantetheinyl transferase family protein n=1 Tax=Streptomyces amakusaensis TaxID=67271 RepID=A0ABW0APF8_9ACTN